MSGIWPPERLLARLDQLTGEIEKTRLALTEPKLGNPKYSMERRRLTDRLEALQNEKIQLLQSYVEALGGGALAAPNEGDWVLQVTHVGPTQAMTAHARVMISAGNATQIVDFWELVDHEVERAVRSIDHLEGQPYRDRRPRSVFEGQAMSLMQDDMAELLRATGLGDHARPTSPHEVMQKEILPAVKALVKVAEGYTALKELRR